MSKIKAKLVALNDFVDRHPRSCFYITGLITGGCWTYVGVKHFESSKLPNMHINVPETAAEIQEMLQKAGALDIITNKTGSVISLIPSDYNPKS